MCPASAPSLRVGLETGLDATSFFVLHLVNWPLWACVRRSVSVPLLAAPWSPSGFFVHGILQARILEWVAIPSSRGASQPRHQSQVSCTADRFFTVLASREALYLYFNHLGYAYMWAEQTGWIKKNIFCNSVLMVHSEPSEQEYNFIFVLWKIGSRGSAGP